MKKYILIIALGVMMAATVAAQEYKIAKSTGRLEITEVNHVTIEGTTGNEIVFVGRSNRGDDDERAKGLRAISGSGLEDNTGLGLSAVDKGGDIIEVRQLKKMDGPNITIKVPKDVKVFFAHTSPHGDAVEFKNFDGEIHVHSVHSGVRLNNAAGRIDIQTVHGDVDASLGLPVKSEINIKSVHGHVDVALPLNTKANLSLSTKFGEILVDPDFKLEIEKVGDMVRYDDKVSGKINGGGLPIYLSSEHNSVYLRKKV
jgi:predicted membrane protein